MYEISSITKSASDTFNRFQGAMMGYKIAESYVNKFLRGDINQAQVEEGLLLSAFPTGLRNHLLELFTNAKFNDVQPDGSLRLTRPSFEKFIREVAEIKTTMINFPYGISDRSALEQNINTRWLTGLPVFPRGVFELIYRTTIKPLLQATKKWKEHDFKKEHLDVPLVKTAWRNITADIISGAISTYLLSRTIGLRKDWRDPKKRRLIEAHSLTQQLSWTPKGIGAELAERLIDDSKDIMYALSIHDAKKAERALKSLSDELLFFTIIIPTLKTIFEAVGDRDGMRNVDVAMSIWKGKIIGGTYAERDWYAALMHALTDSEPSHGDTSVERHFKRIKEHFEK